MTGFHALKYKYRIVYLHTKTTRTFIIKIVHIWKNIETKQKYRFTVVITLDY